MSLAVVYSRAQQGIDAPSVSVEVHLSNGLPGLSIVGLPETAVKESKDRVRGALLNSRFEFPARRITINLAPADLPKEGGRFDLPIAIGILAASGQVPAERLNEYEFAAELALSGALRGIRGVLPLSLNCARAGRTLVCARTNADEAALAGDAAVLCAEHLLEVCAHLSGSHSLVSHRRTPSTVSAELPDLADVRGQQRARRALEVAAAGGHSLLMVGPPGTGKTMLACRMPSILPPLDDEQALEAAAIASISSTGFDPQRWRQRPFRAPHHTASGVALVGGGSHPRPGEISLAHQGVLFLDELPEFDRRVLEVLREPLESGRITISRAARQAEFPARFQLLAAMNPCPCGHLGDERGQCRCTPDQIRRYRARISGPLLDRFDMQVEVARIARAALRSDDKTVSEPSSAVSARVTAARQRQQLRCGRTNAAMDQHAVDRHCRIGRELQDLLDQAMEQLSLSARGYFRILRVARSIADLDGENNIGHKHLTEALSYRRLLRAPTGLEV